MHSAIPEYIKPSNFPLPLPSDQSIAPLSPTTGIDDTPDTLRPLPESSRSCCLATLTSANISSFEWHVETPDPHAQQQMHDFPRDFIYGNLDENHHLSLERQFPIADPIETVRSPCGTSNVNTTRQQSDTCNDPFEAYDHEFYSATPNDLAWRDFVDLSNTEPTSSGSPDAMTRVSQRVDKQYHPLISEDGLTFPASASHGEHHVCTESNRSQSSDLVQRDKAIAMLDFSHCDPEAIMDPLNFMRSHIVNTMDFSSLDWYSLKGSKVGTPFDLIHSQWLWLEMEDLMCCAWEYVLQSVRQRQAARRNLETDTSSAVRAGASNRDRTSPPFCAAWCTKSTDHPCHRQRVPAAS